MTYAVTTTARLARVAFALLAILSCASARAQAPATETLSFASIADTYVDGGTANTNYNTSALLRADASPVRISYLRFAVAGVNGRSVLQARLRLGVAGTSPESGGTVHLISNGSWNEATVTYNTRPAVDGPGLATLGPVMTVGAVVEFNLDGAITADGLYNLAIDTISTNAVDYNSTAATTGQKPTLVLTVAASPGPAVTVLQPANGAAFFVGDTVTLQGSAVDPVDGNLGAAIRWSSSLQGSLGTGASLTTTLGQGSHVITAAVTDSAGLASSATVGVTVSPPPAANTAPLVAVTTPVDGQTFNAGQAITFSGTANDLEDGVLTPALAWTSDVDGALGTGGTFTRALTSGTHHVTARVTDSGGLVGVATVTVAVRAPVATEFLATADATVDASATTTNFGADPLIKADANTLRISYLRFAVTGVSGSVSRAVLRLQVDTGANAGSNVGGLLHTISDTTWAENLVTFATRPALDGPVVASVGPVSAGQLVDFDVSSVVHGNGAYNFGLENSSSDAVEYRSREGGPAPKLILTIAGNAPVVSITAPLDQAVVPLGSPVGFGGSATDVEDGNLSAALTWTSSLDGVIGQGASFTTAALRAGSHTITATVTDSSGLRGQAQSTLVVRAPNTAPTVAITAPADGSAVTTGATVTLTGTATDPEDGNLSPNLVWSSDLDGPLGVGASISTSVLRPGTHTITAAVTDAGGLAGQAQIRLVVTSGNLPPVVTITAPAAGTSAIAGVPVTLSATAADVVDGNLSAQVAWNSNLQGVLGTGSSITTMLVEGTHTIAATVTDSGGLTGAAQLTLVVLPASTNTPPSILIVAPRDGRTATTGEALSFVAVAEDRQDGLLTPRLSWTDDLDGPLGVGGSFTRTLSQGLHHVTVAVTDSGGLPSAVTVAVTVAAPTKLTFPATADTYVDSSRPNSIFGTSTALLAQSSPVRQMLFRFAVQGVPANTVVGARLRLTVGSGTSDGSLIGGTVYSITSNAWSEAKTTYNTRPVIDGAALASQGAVKTNQVVDFDVTAAVTGNGTYNFALVSTSTDSVRYRSREATKGKPQLIITLGSPRVALSGVSSSDYSNGSLASDTTIDARAATFLGSATNSYPLNLGGGAGVWLVGGAVRGQYDPTWTWSEMHAANNAAAVFSNGQLTVDGLRVDDVTDGIRPQNGGAFVIRNAHLSYIRDDGVENDHLHSGLIDDSLFDGVYEGFSARPSPAIVAAGANGSANLWRIENTLVRLQPMPGPDGGSVDGLGNSGFFKWDSWDSPATSLSPKLALHNNIFMAERVSQAGAARMGVPPGQVVSCSNNVVVWLGPGDYPATLPACFTVTKDRSVWDNAVADWLQRHPQVQP